MRGLVHVRAILGNIGTLVIPSQVSVPKAHEAFNADGSLRDEKLAQRIAKVAKELVDTTRRLNVISRQPLVCSPHAPLPCEWNHQSRGAR